MFYSFHTYVEVIRLDSVEILNLAKNVFKGRRWFELFFTKESTDAENNGNIGNNCAYPRISFENKVVVMGRGVVLLPSPTPSQCQQAYARTTKHDFFRHSPCWPEGLQRDVVYLGWPIASSYMSPNAGGVGSCGVSANEYSCTQEPKETLEI